ncbi:hypothetical protein DXA36_31575 [Eisenbergiella sp. OF01-20]|nr:hypothetical protein DXA36_31575 [Eisenbergiella sp. OF01-20]
MADASHPCCHYIHMAIGINVSGGCCFSGMAAGGNYGGTNFFYLHPVSCSGLTFCGGMIKIVN